MKKELKNKDQFEVQVSSASVLAKVGCYNIYYK